MRAPHLHQYDFLPDGSLGPCAECVQDVRESAYNALRSGRTRSSGVVVALCPFHGEKTPSFVYRPRTGSFVCYGCHTRGHFGEDSRMSDRLKPPITKQLEFPEFSQKMISRGSIP